MKPTVGDLVVLIQWKAHFAAVPRIMRGRMDSAKVGDITYADVIVWEDGLRSLTDNVWIEPDTKGKVWLWCNEM